MSMLTGPQDIYRNGVMPVHLKIAECIFSVRPILISTVLGSCVSATFFDPKTRTAAMFHAMLPDSRLDRNPTKSCKYVDSAIESIMDRFMHLKIKPGRLVVKLFGGAFTMQPERKSKVRDVVDVGSKNVSMARARLKAHGLEPAGENVLGDRGRKVFFYTATGEVWMKYVRADATDGRMDAFPA
jgi:chemotaxis protein CheD